MADNDFTLEKLEISKRLHEVETTMVKFIERFEAHTEQDRIMADRITTLLEKHDNMLIGSNGHDGMRIDLDRLKQRSSLVSFVLGAMTVAMVGLLVKAIWSVLFQTS